MLRENPVKSAMYFSKRWGKFLHEFLLGPHTPIGEVLAHYARIEFPNRGSPHVHAFVWILDAPNMEIVSGRQQGLAFIDKYISAQLPEKSNPLYSLVSRLQTHAHTHTCFKSHGKSKCRFDFPREESISTEIQLTNIRNTTGRFYKLARTKESIWVNPYNEAILLKWNANMDIQIVGCKYAAAAYVCTYVCKNEPDSLKKSLSATISKLPTGGSVRKRLSKIGNVLLTHRLISGQAATYRFLNMPMVYSSRDTVFISSYPSKEQFKLIKPKAALKELPCDSTEIYAQGLHEIYMRRPQLELFDSMSLDIFATRFGLH